MNDEEILIHTAFLDKFSTYQGFGVEVIYTNKSITFNYNEKSKKYVDALLNRFMNENDMIIILRCSGRNVSFTSKKMNYNELFETVKNTMDTVKFDFGQDSVIKDNYELLAILDLFEKASLNKMDLTIGINKKEDDTYYKLVSKKYSVQEAFKREGLTVKDHTAYFRKSKVRSVKDIFDTLKTNPLVLEYKIDNNRNGFVGSLNIMFYIAICFSAIMVGMYLILNAPK